MPRNHHEHASKTDKILRKYDELQERLYYQNSPQPLYYHHGHPHPPLPHLQNVHQVYYTSDSESSPVRGDDLVLIGRRSSVAEDDYNFNLHDEFTDPEAILRLKWLDNSPRMSRLREHRQKRLVNKLEQFELWDLEQEQKQKQYEKAREQRYNNIVERLKSQEFVVNTMKKRHESDLEATRDLEVYANDHLFVDALDDPKANIEGPITQYRRFEAEMDEKVKNLQNDLDTLNPRSKIEQAIMPRLERTRENFSVEPQIFTRKGKKILRKPNLNKSTTASKSFGDNTYQNFARTHFITQPTNKSAIRRLKEYSIDSVERPILKPIIQPYHHQDNSDSSVRSLSKLKISNDTNANHRKSVNFSDDVDYKYRSSDKNRLQHADY